MWQCAARVDVHIVLHDARLSTSVLAMERECQAGNGEGQEKDRQDALSAALEADDFAVGGVEGLGSAGVSATADLQGVTSGFHWCLERVVQFDRPDTLPVEHDLIRATADLHSCRFVRHLQRCGHC